MSDFFERWATQARKGVLELAVLNALSQERLYGYELVKRLQAVPGLVIGEGTIYPIMSRLQREGLVKSELEESRGGPARKYYLLSDKGREELAAIRARWSAMVRGVAVLGGDDAD